MNTLVDQLEIPRPPKLSSIDLTQISPNILGYDVLSLAKMQSRLATYRGFDEKDKLIDAPDTSSNPSVKEPTLEEINIALNGAIWRVKQRVIALANNPHLADEFNRKTSLHLSDDYDPDAVLHSRPSVIDQLSVPSNWVERIGFASASEIIDISALNAERIAKKQNSAWFHGILEQIKTDYGTGAKVGIKCFGLHPEAEDAIGDPLRSVKIFISDYTDMGAKHRLGYALKSTGDTAFVEEADYQHEVEEMEMSTIHEITHLLFLGFENYLRDESATEQITVAIRDGDWRRINPRWHNSNSLRASRTVVDAIYGPAAGRPIKRLTRAYSTRTLEAQHKSLRAVEKGLTNQQIFNIDKVNEVVSAVENHPPHKVKPDNAVELTCQRMVLSEWGAILNPLLFSKNPAVSKYIAQRIISRTLAF
jgi:hypothetical protein